MKSFFIAALLLLSANLAAHEYTKQHIFIDHPWARPTFALAKTAAAYLDIQNKGEKADQLQSISVSSEIADTVELHDMVMKGDMMSMQQMLLPVDLSAKQNLLLQPGGKHLMLLGLKAPLKEGTEFPLTLTFAEAGQITVVVKVENQTAEKGGHHHHH